MSSISENLSVFDIRDFTPGIRQRPSPFHPPGAASDAFGCLPSPSGGLMPAPASTQKITATETLAGLVGSSNLVSSEYRITGVFANDPVFSTDSSNPTVPGIDQNNTEIWLGIEYWTDDPDNYRRAVARFHRHRTTPSWEIVWSHAESATFDPHSRPKRCEFANSRSNRTNPNEVGPVVVAWVFDGQAHYSPDDTTPLTTSSYAIPTSVLNRANKMVAHQNRIVVFPLTSLGANTDTVHPDNEAFYWTAPNDLSSLDPLLTSFTNTVAYVEQSHGYEYGKSLSSDQLLLMKRAGGALILQGDLNFFRAIPRPNVKSPGLALNDGVTCSTGFLYPADAGTVWLFEGGDSSRCVADWMEPNFWRPAATEPANWSTTPPTPTGWGHYETSCAQWQHLVLLPSMWVWDQLGGGWWRLASTKPAGWGDGWFHSMDLHWWTSDWTGRWAWGAASGFNTDPDCPVLVEFDWLRPAEIFEWTSHPLAFSLVDQVEIHDVVVWATPENTSSTVEVVVSSDQDPSGVSQTLNLTSSSPRAYRTGSKIGVKGTGIQVKVSAASNETGVGAPRIDAIELTYITDPYTRR